MPTFSATIRSASPQMTIIDVKFGTPGSNSDIVKDADKAFEDLNLQGGGLILISGPITLPAAFTVCNRVKHLYNAVGIFDPKMQGFVIAISVVANHPLGSVIAVGGPEGL